MEESRPATPQSSDTQPQRRSFLVRLAAGAIGSVLILFPFAAGIGVFLDPLRRRRGKSTDVGENFVRIAPLDAVPDDGTPCQFAVTADSTDAWTMTPGQRIGSVFLRRTDKNDPSKVLALSAECPHLGCAVNFVAAEQEYVCPCHVSGFSLDGAKLSGPSLRGLDSLKVKIVDRNGTPEVWVDYERFRTGIAQKVPV